MTVSFVTNESEVESEGQIQAKLCQPCVACLCCLIYLSPLEDDIDIPVYMYAYVRSFCLGRKKKLNYLFPCCAKSEGF